MYCLSKDSTRWRIKSKLSIVVDRLNEKIDVHKVNT